MSKLVNPFIKYPAAGPPPGDSTLNNGIEHHWKCDEAISTTRIDSVGSANLTDVNGVEQDASGQINQAAKVVQSSGARLHTTLTAPFSFNSRDYTFLCWYRRYTTGLAGSQTVTFGRFTVPFRIDIASSGTELVLQVGSTSRSNIYTSPIPWVQCGFTHNATTRDTIVYFDGVPETTFQVTPSDPDSGIQVGYRNGGAECGFDDASVWGRVLSGAEVLEHYNQGVAGNSYPWPGLP